MATHTPTQAPRRPLHPGHTNVAPVHIRELVNWNYELDPQVRSHLNEMKQGISRLQMTGMAGPLPAADVVDVLNQMLNAISYALKRGQ